MLLAIDIGNSTTKLAGFRSTDAPTWVRSFATRRDVTADEVEVLLAGVLALGGLEAADLSGAVVVSVVPPVLAAFEAVARQRLPGTPLLQATAATLPLPVRVDHPEGVGSDRLVAAFAAHRLYGGPDGGPLVVADLGTAITVDAVAADGAFLGGAIAPGPGLGLRALAEHTAKLPRVALGVPPRAIATDTVTALQAGVGFGWLDLVAGLIGRVRTELAASEAVPESSIRTVITGGYAASDWGASLPADVVDEHLTLKGLTLLHAEVAGRAVGAGAAR
jgi:type III pantothenate kinase